MGRACRAIWPRYASATRGRKAIRTGRNKLSEIRMRTVQRAVSLCATARSGAHPLVRRFRFVHGDEITFRDSLPRAVLFRPLLRYTETRRPVLSVPLRSWRSSHLGVTSSPWKNNPSQRQTRSRDPLYHEIKYRTGPCVEAVIVARWFFRRTTVFPNER